MNNKVYNEWEKKYRNEKIVNPMKHLKENCLDTLKKLNINVENREYTEYEYDLLKGEVSLYYKEDDYNKDDLAVVKSLEGTGVSQEEYDELINNFNEIDEVLKL